MKKNELKRMFDEGLISVEKYKEELFSIETAPKKPKKPERIYESLTDEDFAKLLMVTKKPHHKVALLIAYYSGLRISEILSLQPEDIDLKERRIFVRQGKGGRDRPVNCPKRFRAIYMQYIPLKIKKRALEALFLRNTLKCGINRIIGYFDRKDSRTKELKQIPIYRFHFHCLRKSYGTHLLEKGVPPNQVQALLGHKSLATTTKYTGANQSTAIDAALEAGF